MDGILQTMVGLLDGPGVVKELDYGTYILLAAEWIKAYAQAVIRTLRSAENDLGVLSLRSIAEGRLIYQSIGRDGVPVEMRWVPPLQGLLVFARKPRPPLCCGLGYRLSRLWRYGAWRFSGVSFTRDVGYRVLRHWRWNGIRHRHAPARARQRCRAAGRVVVAFQARAIELRWGDQRVFREVLARIATLPSAKGA